MGDVIASPTGEANRDPNYAQAQVIEIPKRFQSVGNPWSLVQDRFDITSAFAEDSYDNTQGFIEDMNGLMKQLNSWNIPDIVVDSPEVGDIDYTVRPTLGALDLDLYWPDNTAEKPDLNDLPEIGRPDIPIYNIPDPQISLPDKPPAREIQEPGDAPTPQPVPLPPKPTYTMPPVPYVGDLTIPALPNIDLPVFDAEFIEEVFADPPGMVWEESPFNSEIWNNLLTTLNDGIVNGGTGLDPATEQAIWARALLRLQVDEQAAYEEIENYHSTQGWDMPQGVLNSTLKEKSDEIGRNRAGLTFDIAIKQADMTYADSQFKIQMGMDAEKVLREFHNSQMNRLLDAQKSIAQNAIAILEAHIKRYNVKIEKYKADSEVYRTRIEAARNQVEIFKAQVEGVKVQSEVQKNLVDIYTAQVGAIEMIAKIYETEMQGANIASQIETRLIEAYKTRVDAYVAEIGGERAKYEVFAIENEAEKIKVDIFSERIKAYTSQVGASTALVNLDVQVLQGEATRNQQELDQYRAELAVYSVEVDAAAKKVGAVVDAYRGEVDGYSAETQAQAAKYGALIEEIRARIAQAQFNLEKEKAIVDSTTQGYIALKKLQLDGLSGVTNVSAQLAASAMNAVNASASFGYSSGESLSSSFSYGASSSENHSFSYKTKQP